jgi:uncharacterized protein (TIGR03086 family)
MEKTNLSAEMADAAAEAARVVRDIPDTKSLDDPSLCGDWDLRTLLNHLILWTSYSAERRAHGESVAEDLMSKDFTADPGFREDYAKQLKKAVDAWSEPQAWEGTRDMMGTATPATDIGAMLIMEMALHGWDVARATGQEYHATDALAAVVEQTVQAQAELFRQYDGFADPVKTADDATAFAKALALSGRDPN